MPQTEADPFRGLRLVQAKIDEATRALAPARSALNGLQTYASDLDALRRAVSSIADNYRNSIESVRRLVEPTRFSSRHFQVAEEQMQLLDAAGLLPHYTTPFNLLKHKPTGDGESLAQSLEKYYLDNWKQTRSAILLRLRRYSVDDESKAVVREALTLHRQRRFRSVVRMLFPEIERIARNELLNNDLKAAALRKLMKVAGSLTPAETEPRGYYGWRLYTRLTEHIYSPARSVRQVSKLARDHVPNRHAAIHGLVSYSSHRNSLNTLIMADYVLQM